MNPKPLALLNHLTVPLMRVTCIPFTHSFWGRQREPEARTSRPPLGTAQGDLHHTPRSEMGNGARVILGVLARLLVTYDYARNWLCCQSSNRIPSTRK